MPTTDVNDEFAPIDEDDDWDFVMGGDGEDDFDAVMEAPAEDEFAPIPDDDFLQPEDDFDEVMQPPPLEQMELPTPEAMPDATMVAIQPPPMEGPMQPVAPPPPMQTFGSMYPMPQQFAEGMMEPTPIAPEEALVAQEMEKLKVIEKERHGELGEKYREAREKYFEEGNVGTYWPEDFADLELYPDASRSFWSVLANEPLSMMRQFTSPIISAIKGEDPDVKLGRRVEESTQALTLKGAKEKLERGVALEENEKQAVMNDKGLVEELKMVGKFIAQSPGEFMGTVIESVADDLPALLMTNKGVGAILKAGQQMAGRSKLARKILQTTGKVPKITKKQVIATDIAGEAAVEYAIEKGKGAEYGVKHVAGAVVPGTVMGVAEMGAKKALRGIKARGKPKPLPIITEEAFQYPGDKVDTGPLSTEKVKPPEDKFPRTKKLIIDPVKRGYEKARKSHEMAVKWLRRKRPETLKETIDDAPVPKVDKTVDDAPVPKVDKTVEAAPLARLQKPIPLPKRVAVGMTGFSTTPIKKTLYRETNVDGLDYLLRETLSNSIEKGAVVNNLHFSDVKHLALGQGDNKGILIEFDGDFVSGKASPKIGTGTELFPGKEYTANFIGREAIKSFTLPPKAKLNPLARSFAKRNFDITRLDDGSTKFVRKEKPNVLPRHLLDDKGLLKDDVITEVSKELTDVPKTKKEIAEVDPSKTILYDAPPKVDTKTGYLSKKEELVYKFVRESEPILKIERLYEKFTGKKLTDDKSLVTRIDQALGYKGIAESYVRKKLLPIIHGLKPDEYRSLNEYLIAKRAKHLYTSQRAKGKEQYKDILYTEKWAEKVIKEHEGKNFIKERAPKVWAYNQELLSRLHKAGHLPTDEFIKLKKEPHYVEFRRDLKSVIAEEAGGKVFSADAFTSTDKGVSGFKAYEDRAARLHSPMTSMIDRTSDAFEIITKSRIFSSVIDMVDDSPDLQKIIKSTTKDADLIPGRQKVALIRDGKVKYYDVPQEIGEATVDIGRYGTKGGGFAYEAARTVSDIFRAAVVSLNPEFAVSNMFRDQADAMYFSGKSPFGNALKGLMHFWNKDDVYKAYIKGGGGIGGAETGIRGAGKLADEALYGEGLFNYNKIRDTGLWDNANISKKGEKPENGVDYVHGPYKKDKKGNLVIDENALEAEKHGKWGTKTDLEKIFGKRTKEALKITATSAKNVLGWVNEYSEMMGRLGNFEYALNMGASPEKAIHIARQSQVDFLQMGKGMRSANQIIPFLNPAIQGTHMLLAKMKKKPEDFAMNILKTRLIPAAGLLAYNSVNDNYKNISDREKENNYIIMLNVDSKNYIKFPKGHVDKLLVNPFQFAMEIGMGTSDKKVGEFFLDAGESLLPTTPTGALPPILKIPLEIATNWNLFWDKEIYNKAAEGALRATGRTSETLKDIAFGLEGIPALEKILGSPAMVQHGIEGLLGGTGKNVLFLADLMRGKVKGKKAKFQHLPIFRRIYGESADWKSDIDRDIRKGKRKLIALLKDKKSIIAPFHDYETGKTDKRAVPYMKRKAEAEYKKLQENMRLKHKANSSINFMRGKIKKIMDYLEKLEEKTE